jgi:hypothetical protein
MALIAAMDRGRRHGTAWAARRRRCGRQLEAHVCRRNGHLGEAQRTAGWEQRRHNGVKFLECMAHHRILYRQTSQLRSLSPQGRKTLIVGQNGCSIASRTLN